ncbi:DUF3828 domain-containing protein [Methylobacillus flagellatus]|uniref:DUF3828 domain-containing protein n=1 Tax=Methylobacillus flagellatus TaxID=405 RepID=UPI0010F8CE09|nr:DUF3828 domain-containing protein [Methylobacillus flagellatus]
MKSRTVYMGLLVLVLATAAAAYLSVTMSRAASPADMIKAFYRAYFQHISSTSDRVHAPALPFSKAFQAAITDNHQQCVDYDGVCGFGASGDVYLNAQDHDPGLSYEAAETQVQQVAPDLVQASFELFPSLKQVHQLRRTVAFRMLQENGHWVVDDIVYDGQYSARQQIQEENASLQAERQQQAQ